MANREPLSSHTGTQLYRLAPCKKAVHPPATDVQAKYNVWQPAQVALETRYTRTSFSGQEEEEKKKRAGDLTVINHTAMKDIRINPAIHRERPAGRPVLCNAGRRTHATRAHAHTKRDATTRRAKCSRRHGRAARAQDPSRETRLPLGRTRGRAHYARGVPGRHYSAAHA